MRLPSSPVASHVFAVTNNSSLLSLTFHKIASDASPGDVYTQSPERLRAVIELANRFGLQFTTWEARDANPPSAPASYLVLTFDDSFENDYTDALPILQEQGIPAAFFIVPRRIGRGQFLTWDQVRQLSAAGMLIGSHSLTHTPLTQLTRLEIRNELVASRQEIEDQIQKPVAALSFPNGYYNRLVLELAFKSGYHYLASSSYGIDRLESGQLLKGRLFHRNCIEARISDVQVASILHGHVPISLRLTSAAKRRFASLIGLSRYEALSRSRR